MIRIIGTDEWGHEYKGKMHPETKDATFNKVTTILRCHDDGTVTSRGGELHYMKKWRFE